jgi:hypothetical protein
MWAICPIPRPIRFSLTRSLNAARSNRRRSSLIATPAVEAQDAITKFNGVDYDGRPMTVSEAKPMVPRENRGAGGGGGFGGGRDSGGGRGNRW